MAPTYSHTDDKLIHKLFKISKEPKLIKRSDYVAPGDPEKTIQSWKMNEHKYRDVPSPFPTLARGLFTTEVSKPAGSSSGEKAYRVVIRGYDKFFNIGEVPWTTVCDAVGFTRTFTEYVAVGLSRSADNQTIHSLPKVKRLHHLHCRSHSNKTLGHFKTFSWAPQQYCA